MIVLSLSLTYSLSHTLTLPPHISVLYLELIRLPVERAQDERIVGSVMNLFAW